MSGIVGSKFNHRGSGIVAQLGTDGQHLLSSGAGVAAEYETVAAATTDLNPVRQDIATLALRQAVNENKAAFNLPATFIDQFEDDTGFGSETTGDRNSQEYWSPVTASAGGVKDDAWSGEGWSYTTTWNVGVNVSAMQNDSGGGSYVHWASVPVNTIWDLKSSKAVLGTRFYNNCSSACMTTYTVATSPDNVTFTTQTGQQDGTGSHTAAPNQGATGGVWTKFLFTSGGTETPVSARYIKTTWTGSSGGNGNMGLLRQHIYKENISVNATGTLIGVANVPGSAQTKVSGVALYKNDEGTATIGTDLKIYATCNGGTNWTEMGYTTVTPTFSSGIIMLKLDETTCTEGSDVRYKAVWANQSDGSKETSLHGIALNY